MLSASHVAESLRDSEEPQLGCGVSLGEADLRSGVQREVSKKAIPRTAVCNPCRASGPC